MRLLKTDLLIGNGSPANGSNVTLEEKREPHAPSKGAEDGDRKELGVGFRPFSSGRMFFSLHHSVNRAGRIDVRRNEMMVKGAKKEKVTSKEGPSNPSRSATVVDPLTLEPSSRSGHNPAIPPMPGSSTRINVEPSPLRLSLPPNLEGELSTFPPCFEGSPGD